MNIQINEFDFYKKLVVPLILQAPHHRDRYLAAAWLKKLEDSDLAEESLRLCYLKLLILNLQRGKLIGIFSDSPVSYNQLIDFRKDFDIHEFAKCMIEKFKEEKYQMIKDQIYGFKQERPPMHIEYSPCLKEYAAAQDIPNFGVQSYYAFSKEPLTKWKRYSTKTVPTTQPRKLKSDITRCLCVNNIRDQACLLQKLEKTPFFIPQLNIPLCSNMNSKVLYPDTPTWGSNINELRGAGSERKHRPFANKL